MLILPLAIIPTLLLIAWRFYLFGWQETLFAYVFFCGLALLLLQIKLLNASTLKTSRFRLAALMTQTLAWIGLKYCRVRDCRWFGRSEFLGVDIAERISFVFLGVHYHFFIQLVQLLFYLHQLSISFLLGRLACLNTTIAGGGAGGAGGVWRLYSLVPS